jgi:hypothetical protein
MANTLDIHTHDGAIYIMKLPPYVTRRTVGMETQYFCACDTCKHSLVTGGVPESAPADLFTSRMQKIARIQTGCLFPNGVTWLAHYVTKVVDAHIDRGTHFKCPVGHCHHLIDLTSTHTIAEHVREHHLEYPNVGGHMYIPDYGNHRFWLYPISDKYSRWFGRAHIHPIFAWNSKADKKMGYECM